MMQAQQGLFFYKYLRYRIVIKISRNIKEKGKEKRDLPSGPLTGAAARESRARHQHKANHKSQTILP